MLRDAAVRVELVRSDLSAQGQPDRPFPVLSREVQGAEKPVLRSHSELHQMPVCS
jgi:hypothetical protein